jgi:hypothetical protein
MVSKGILIDTMPLQFKLEEDSSGNGKLYLRGPLSEGNIKNRNGRIYPTNLLERELKKISPDIQSRRIVGELDHPADLKIHLDRVSHFITEAHFEGNKVIGKIEVIQNTPCGDILAGLIKSGIQLGVSSRAMGSTARNKEGDDIVQEDFSLVTWDVVAQPSNYSSWLNISESFNLTKNYENLDEMITEVLKATPKKYYTFKTIDDLLK